MKKNYKHLWSFILSLLFVVAVFLKAGIYFETNDDKIITEILAGTSLLEGNPHAIYVNYFLALPLSLLYQLTSHIPWYGGMLILFHALAYFFICDSIFERCVSKTTMIIMSCVLGFFMLLNIYHISMIQYTSTAALLAVAGYSSLILFQDNKKNTIVFFVLELLAFLLRTKAMLMIQPLGAVAFLSVCLLEKTDDFRVKSKKIAEWGIVIGAVLLIGTTGSFIGYSDEGWQKYKEFNHYREILFDYNQMPAYEEVQIILDKYQVTEMEYFCFYNYVIMDWELPTECLEELAGYVTAKKKVPFDLGETLQLLWNDWNGNGYMGINKACIVLCIGIASCTLLLRRWNLLLQLFVLIATQSTLMGYLLYQGRTPTRVMYPLMVSTVLLILVLAFREFTKDQIPKWALFAVTLVLLLWGDRCVDAGRTQYRYAKETNDGHAVYIEGLIEVQEYCGEHAQNPYILDSWSFCYYRGSAIDTRIYQKANCVMSGCWYSNSPTMRSFLDEYIGVAPNNLHLILYETGTEREKFVLKFYEEKTGKKAEISDYLATSSGLSYTIYSFH